MTPGLASASSASTTLRDRGVNSARPDTSVMLRDKTASYVCVTSWVHGGTLAHVTPAQVSASASPMSRVGIVISVNQTTGNWRAAPAVNRVTVTLKAQSPPSATSLMDSVAVDQTVVEGTVETARTTSGETRGSAAGHASVTTRVLQVTSATRGPVRAPAPPESRGSDATGAPVVPPALSPTVSPAGNASITGTRSSVESEMRRIS